MMRKVAHHIDLTAGIDSAQWEQFLPPAEKWVVLGQPASTTEQTQEQTQTVRSVSPTPASMRGLTPAEFRDLQHHQAMVFNAASQAQPESQQQPPVELVAGIENHEERAEDLEQTAKFLPFFEWEESEEKELKVRMAQAPELKFYPDVVSQKLPDRGNNQLNKRLLQLEADAFHMTKLGVISFKKSGSVEDLARSVELMTLKAAEVTRSVNDIRIAHFLALPVLDDADATKRESQERQEKRLEELMEKKEKMTVQRRKLQSVDPLFFSTGPRSGALTLSSRRISNLSRLGCSEPDQFQTSSSERSRKGEGSTETEEQNTSVLQPSSQSEINTRKILMGTKDNTQLIAPTVGNRLGGRTRYFSAAWQEFGLAEVIAKGIKVEWGEDGPPTAGGVTIRVTPECQGDERISGGHSRRTQRGSDQGNDKWRSENMEPNLRGCEVGRWVEKDPGLPHAESECRSTTFQNGIVFDRCAVNHTRMLDVLTRPQTCISSCRNPQARPTTFRFPSQRTRLYPTNFMFRTYVRATTVYKASSAGNRTVQACVPNRRLFGRFPGNRQIEGRIGIECSSPQREIRTPRVHNQLQEVTTGGTAADSLPRAGVGFNEHDGQGGKGEEGEDARTREREAQATRAGWRDACANCRFTCRQTTGNGFRRQSLPLPVTTSGRLEGEGGSVAWMGWKRTAWGSRSGRVRVVEAPIDDADVSLHSLVQSVGNSQHRRKRVGDRGGLVEEREGGELAGTVQLGGETVVEQQARSGSCGEGFRRGDAKGPDQEGRGCPGHVGQFCVRGEYQQTIVRPFTSSTIQTSIPQSRPELIKTLGGACGGRRQRSCGSVVQDKGHHRLQSETSELQTNLRVLPMQADCRRICIAAQSTSSSILVPDRRRGGSRNECTPPGLGKRTVRFCLSPDPADSAGTGQVDGGADDIDFSSSGLAVDTRKRHFRTESESYAVAGENGGGGSEGTGFSSDGERTATRSPPSILAGEIWEGLVDELEMEVDTMVWMLAGLSKETVRQYAGAIRRWIEEEDAAGRNWKDIDGIRVANFLARWMRRSGSRGTTEAARSALSFLSQLFGKGQVGVSLPVTATMRGIRTVHPTKAKYEDTWDAKILEDEILKRWVIRGQVEEEMVQTIIAALLMMQHAVRFTEMARIRRDSVQMSKGKYETSFMTRLKTGEGWERVTVNERDLNEGLRICDWITELDKRRGRSWTGQLLGERARERDAGDIAAGIKSLMKSVGLDTDKYGAYSLKHAGRSRNKRNGMSDLDNAKQARLSTSSTVLRKFYIKPISSPNSLKLSSSLNEEAIGRKSLKSDSDHGSERRDEESLLPPPTPATRRSERLKKLQKTSSLLSETSKRRNKGMITPSGPSEVK
ncbi:hypothetical protein BLNAU_12131 [Blattamonas nauphoetae]|uniref:Core-binding (CB) domain-containing protein n=1 Tax=Blattamonas nauphoetae TaxID=2049346 RepID=A0ABQ9XN80_9EUKA|nr:hypothetical protein BLNAU_12131 [Blattamonas nauphoetae]